MREIRIGPPLTEKLEPYWNHGTPFVPGPSTRKARVCGPFLSSGGGIRTRDLRVMSPSLTLCALACSPTRRAICRPSRVVRRPTSAVTSTSSSLGHSLGQTQLNRPTQPPTCRPVTRSLIVWFAGLSRLVTRLAFSLHTREVGGSKPPAPIGDGHGAQRALPRHWHLIGTSKAELFPLTGVSPAYLQVLLRGERRDLNPRPPGPQPGALPN